MSLKTISTLSLSIAIVVAAISAGVIHFKRAVIAQSKAEARQAEADAAEAAARQAKKNADAKAAEARAAKDNLAAKAQEAKNLAAEKENDEIEAKTALENRKAKEAIAAAAEAEAMKARELKEAEAIKLKTAREEREKEKLALAKAEAAKAEAASKLALEKQKSDKVIAEAKLLELRQLDLASMERELLDWKRDLDERERALTPEKTIADLSWAGGVEDTIIDEKGNLRKQVKEVYDPEKDMSIPAESRRLARAERLVREARGEELQLTRERVISVMEKLYVEALKANRVIEAEHIKGNILTMYPDWKFQK